MIGKKLKELRKVKGYSISKLSLKSGVSRTFLGDLEKGKYSNPTLKVICSLCLALNITPNDLIPKEYYEVRKWKS
ncbi:helix-turn-helix transcriptional regulator [Clostridium sp. YIM B02505]|uniref:Helix-turn-helix transcriptional regulator n=1 Tax=Clostridium yunnanense TaxID=2800325 RepID=A0ABS1EQI8_9CLOT|nr:helix-turn-helix transcriptional regulator [Clostridium yunnanense]MBK1811563.1 helix-turn-helix transcriptional regulator [Clostridium yunnanense]